MTSVYSEIKGTSDSSAILPKARFEGITGSISSSVLGVSERWACAGESLFAELPGEVGGVTVKASGGRE